MDSRAWLGSSVTVVVETGRGGHTKRRRDGSVDFVSPLPTPFDYGHVPGQWGGDGDPLDALVLGGPRLPGDRVQGEVVGVVAFVDDGDVDLKLVVSVDGPASAWDRRRVHTFFGVYVWLKRALYRVRRRRHGPTVVRGIHWHGGPRP